MSKFFWIPFATGIFHSVSREQNKSPQWGITNSILTTNALFHAGFRFNEEWNLKQDLMKFNSQSSSPRFFFGTIGAAFVVTGANFCLGHLLTKKAYPVLKDKFN